VRKNCVNKKLLIGNRILKIDEAAESVELPTEAAAAKLSLGLRKPHFRVLNPKIREFDGNV
jgi:hypothetical protein